MPLLHRLRLVHQFGILGLLALLMAGLPSALYLSETAPVIAAAERESAGIPAMVALQDVVRLTQQHRGLAAGMLGGNARLEARRPETRDALNQALGALDVQLRAQVPQALQTTWAGHRQRWTELEQAVAQRQLKPAESSARHTALIGAMLAFNAALLDEFGLTLDPALDKYALIMAGLGNAPALAERLGQLRAQGTGFLATGHLPPENRAALTAVRARAQELYDEMIGNLAKATASNPQLKAHLGDGAAALQARIGKTLAMAEQDLIQTTTLSLSPELYFQTFTDTIDAVYTFNALALKDLAVLLNDHAADLHRMRWIALAALLGLTGLSLALATAFARGILRQLGGEPAQARAVARRIAAGDMSQPVPVAGGDADSLLAAMAQMQAQLVSVVADVRHNAESVATASTQIAQGNHDLSGRTEDQAAGLQAAAAAMEQLSTTVNQNADNAEQARQLAQGAADVAARGGQAVGDVVATMRGIDASSGRIAEIIGVIDGIAFQTNILALNAAVEAARAGEQGRGFAVVASEVRSLAQRSAAAAQEIKGLIGASVERVAQGTRLVDAAGATMTDVVAAVQRMNQIMGEISAASAEQRNGVAQVGDSVARMDRATQQNAALVEQSAAATESLKDQAQRLVQSVAVFRLSQR